MIEIIKIESKRILSKEKFLAFLVIVLLFSACSTYISLRRFTVPKVDGNAVTWQENLAHTRNSLQGKSIDWELIDSLRQQENVVYAAESSLDEIVRLNYEGKSVQELTDGEIRSFYQIRLSRIRAMLQDNQYIKYTQEEQEHFLLKAEKLAEIPFGYAEGWKILNRDMEVFVPLLLIMIAVFLFPLFGVDPKISMDELNRSSKYGKLPLSKARILTAFIVGTVLYALGTMLFPAIKMAPFGLEGGNQYIQSNMTTFFSLYNITYLQQYFINVTIGFVALLFVACLSLLLTVVMEKVMNSAVVFAFFWITLLLFGQLYLWQVNHYFADFMPLRLTTFSHYYIGNEIYRFAGMVFESMVWCPAVALALSVVMIGITVWWLWYGEHGRMRAEKSSVVLYCCRETD